MPNRRPAGWYPDPWGTDDERWFDGAAWTRSTRPPGGATRARGAADAPPGPVPAGPPAGWYPDPWGLGALRWWDGSTWTGHVAHERGSGTPPLVSGPPRTPVDGAAGCDEPAAGPGTPTVSLARQLADEQFHARLARAALGVAGPAAAIGVVSLAAQVRWAIDRWPALRDPQRRAGEVSELTGGYAAIAGQAVVAALLVAAVMFLLWFHRAVAVARRAGIHGPGAGLGPGWAVGAFLIPVANLWLPYLVARSLLPDAHRARFAAGRWWGATLGFTGATAGTAAAAFVHELAMSVLAGLAAILALTAAGAGRHFVEEVTRAHAELTAGGPGHR